MKRLTYFILACTLLFSSCKQNPPIESKSTEKQTILQEQFEEYFSALTSLGKFNGVISVSQNGEAVIHKAYNLKTNPKHSLYVTEDSQFDIHSVSKLMAYYLILQLEKEGKIQQHDKLHKFLPNFPRGEEITIEMLLEHRSGLPRELSKFEGDLIDLEVAQIVDLVQQETLIFEPGEDVQYSNLGYQLLYAIIGKLTDGSFEDCLISELFMPLELNSSGAHFYTKQKNIKNLAANHELDAAAIVQVDNILEDEFKQARIYSTAEDLTRLLQVFQTNPIAHQMAKDSVIQHSGGSDGVRAQVYLDLKTNTSFVLLTNFEGIPFQKTIKDMISMIEGKPYDVPKKLNRQSIPLEDDFLKRYKGTYVFADMNNLELRVEVEDGRLILFQDGEIAGKLVAENKTTFFENPSDEESFEFIANEQGGYDVLMGWKGVKLPGVKK